MKKLKLDLEALAVDSFRIAGARGEGTVEAHEVPTYPYKTCDAACSYGCTTGASYLEAYCPPASTATTCVAYKK
jgi:hypothetical protein